MSNQDEVYRDLLDNLADGVYFTDVEGRITYWNKGAERLSGFSKSEVLGKLCRENILMHLDLSGLALCTSGCPLRATARDGQPREADIYLHHKDGSRRPIHIRVTPLKDDSGNVIGAIEVFSDNTAKTQMAERLAQMEQLALLDPLTGLPNRRYLESHIYARLEEFRRDGWPFGILYIDIDNFKLVNDRFGHQAGDRVLRIIAKTLDANSRYFDAVGRWGGEEFLAIVHNVDQKRLQEIAERMRMLVDQSVLTDLESLHVTVSIGGTRVSVGDTADSALRRADANLYKAKKSGKNCVCLADQIPALEALAILAVSERITKESVPMEIRIPPGDAAQSNLEEIRAHAERNRIRQALEEVDWNVSAAARTLGIERTRLHKRIRALGLSRND